MLALGLATQTYAESLNQALLKAYRNNPSLNSFRAQLRATDERVPQAKSGWRPVITAQGSVSQTWSKSDPGGFNEFHSESLSVQLTQPLFRGFKTVEGVKQAKAVIEATRAQLLVTEQQVLLSVVASYLAVVRDRQVLNLRERNVVNLQKQVRAAKARFDAGEVTKTDVSQASARVSGAKAAVASARANLEASLARYEEAVGTKADRNMKAPRKAKLPASLEAALALARQTNPSILAAEQQRHAAAHAIEVVKGDLLPEASLNASASFTNNPSGQVDWSRSARIEGVVTVPIYEGGQVYSRVREAKQIESQRQLDVIAAGRSVRQGVKIAWNVTISANQAIHAARDQVEAAKQSLDGVTQEYLVGSRSTIDVLNAEQELLNARISLIGAEHDAVLASYQLLAAIGKLTARHLALGGPYYDPRENYVNVKDKWIGIDADVIE